jgi:hypothetical protein
LPIDRFTPGERAPFLLLNKLDMSRVCLDAVVNTKILILLVIEPGYPCYSTVTTATQLSRLTAKNVGDVNFE